ncbi:MAG TPA: hypothetical protein VH482_10040 [Thermomicrobiales bacterium]|jgi:multiple sugar transport system substrate-binding protein
MTHLDARLRRQPLTRRTVVKAAVGTALCTTGIAGKSYRRALADEGVRAQILAIPGAGKGNPTEADMEKVGELCLRTQNRGKFAGQTVTFMGINNPGFHDNVFRPLCRAWEDATGATIRWIDVTQDAIFGKFQQATTTGTIEFDVLEGGVAWEGDLLGGGLALAMPDWVKQQVEIDDYVKSLQLPVGTWDGTLYRLSIDADTHLFNVRADVFADPDLAARWTSSGGAGPWGIPTTWPQVQAATAFLKGTETNGLDNYGIIDVCQPGGGFSWYFYASRAAAYVKHPAERAWLFDPATMAPRIDNPGFVRAVQDVVDALPFEPVDQLGADMGTTFTEFLGGQGTMAAWWGDLGSVVYTYDGTVFLGNPALQVRFAVLPGAPAVFNAGTGEWDTLPSGPNVASNTASGGWGLYVMQAAAQRGVGETAWDLAAHLGGPDLSLWLSCYPSGMQPYRYSHFDIDAWVAAGYPRDHVQSYLTATRAAYDTPNVAAEPRIPGIFRYYIAAEEPLARAFAGEIGAQEAMDAAAQSWDEITDQLGRDRQIKAYQDTLLA